MLKEILLGFTPVSSRFLARGDDSRPEYLKRRMAPAATSEATAYYRAVERSTLPPSSFLLRDLKRNGRPLNQADSI